ncbi:MAG: hypothetical protein R3D88_05625 [Alphaproteobacteria bacterium]|nr:hypothetical protein [Alphaproteobacteria bacterium]
MAKKKSLTDQFDQLFDRSGFGGGPLSVESTKENKFVDARYAAVLVSFLSYLECIENAARKHQQEVLANQIQCVFQELSATKIRPIFSEKTQRWLEKTRTKDFLLGDFKTMQRMCRDIIKVGSTGVLSERYYVDTNHYDQQFADIGNDYLDRPIQRSDAGVYHLSL